MANHTRLYDPADFAPTILERLSAGDSLDTICGLDIKSGAYREDWPSPSLIRSWALTDQPPGFTADYARARDMGWDSIAERALRTASDQTRDPNCRRVEVDTVKWLVGKRAPYKYGDKLAVGGIPGEPVEVVVTWDKPKP